MQAVTWTAHLRRLLGCAGLALVALVPASCSDRAEANRRENMRQDLEAGRNEAMAQSTRIRQLRDVMRYRLDSLTQLQDTTALQAQMSDMQKAEGALQGALESIDRWVAAYDPDSVALESDAGTAYLVRQSGFINAMRQSMNHALADGETVARRYNLPIPPDVVRIEAEQNEN